MRKVLAVGFVLLVWLGLAAVWTLPGGRLTASLARGDDRKEASRQ